MKIILLFLLSSLIILRANAQHLSNADNALLLEYYQTQHFTAAADYLKKNFPEPVTDLKVLNQLAYSNQMANRLPEAQAYFEKIYDTDTTNVSALWQWLLSIKGAVTQTRLNYI